MSVIDIDSLVKELRDLENDPEIDCYGINELNNVCAKAADIIEELSAKLEEAGNMANDRWILCEDRLPDDEVLCCDLYGEMLIGWVSRNPESKTGFYVESDNECMYDCVKWMEKPKS